MPTLRIQNVHRLRDVSIDLGAFTVLVGPNGCGKTTVLKCLELLCGVGGVDLATEPGSLVDCAGKQWSTSAGAPERLGRGVRLRLEANRMVHASPIVRVHPMVGTYGEHLGGALAQLKLADEPTFDRVMDDARRVVPRLREVRMVPEGSNIELRADFDHAKGVAQRFLSTGTLYTLALLVTVHADRHEAGAHWYLLDDLGDGLHPRAQLELVRCLKAVADVAEINVVVATHSPYVVEAAGLDAIWALGTGTSGATIARRLRDHPHAQAHADSLTAGEFWSWVGEEWLAGLEP